MAHAQCPVPQWLMPSAQCPFAPCRMPRRVSIAPWRQVSATHSETVGQLGLLERGLFGEDLAGYTSHVRAARPAIDLWRTVLLVITWGLPVGVAALAVVACVLRRGALALHSGQATVHTCRGYTRLLSHTVAPYAIATPTYPYHLRRCSCCCRGSPTRHRYPYHGRRC